MSNSVKKVPFLAKSLFEKITEMNLTGNGELYIYIYFLIKYLTFIL